MRLAFLLHNQFRVITRTTQRIWMKQRNKEWWNDVVGGVYGDSWWVENLRMSRETFVILCDELRPHLERQRTQFREPVSVETRVAVTIWRLGTNVEYRTIAALFGLGRSTVGEIVLDTCDTIACHLIPRYIRIPEGVELQEVINGFQRRWGFPQTVGAIDGSHIPILKPQQSPSDYYNRKGYYSILMQAVVDYRGVFIDVNIGWPGKVNCVFLSTNFIHQGTVLLLCFPLTSIGS